MSIERNHGTTASPRSKGRKSLGTSFKTTNLLESVMARVEAKTERVDRWRTSDQKLRWCAAALLAVEKQFRRVKGCAHLPLLEAALATKIIPSAIAAA